MIRIFTALFLGVSLVSAFAAPVTDDEITDEVVAISCINNAICLPNEHCLNGQCVQKPPFGPTCFTDIDCFPQVCGSDRICHDR